MKALQTWLATQEVTIPILNLSAIQSVQDSIIGKLSDAIYAQVVTVIDVTAIRFMDDAHQSAYEKACSKLLVIAHDKGIDSQEFINARDNAKKALSQFVALY